MKDKYSMTLEEYFDSLKIADFFRLMDFEKEIQLKKIEAVKQTKEKAINLAVQYYSDYDSSKDKEKYIHYSKWVVTGFLFQPPLLTSSKYEERKVINEVFADWDTNYFWSIFSKNLDILFNL